MLPTNVFGALEAVGRVFSYYVCADNVLHCKDAREAILKDLLNHSNLRANNFQLFSESLIDLFGLRGSR